MKICNCPYSFNTYLLDMFSVLETFDFVWTSGWTTTTATPIKEDKTRVSSVRLCRHSRALGYMLTSAFQHAYNGNANMLTFSRYNVNLILPCKHANICFLLALDIKHMWGWWEGHMFFSLKSSDGQWVGSFLSCRINKKYYRCQFQWIFTLI